MQIIHIGTLVFTIVAIAITYICVLAKTKLKIPMDIRRLVQLDQIDEMVKSTAERGKPILFAPGGLASTDSYTPAWGTIYEHVGEMAGSLNLRTFTTSYLPDITVVLGDYLREGYIRSGHPERFRMEDQICIQGSTFTWTQGTIGIVQRIQPGAVFMLGSWDWASHVNVMKAASLLPDKPLMIGGAGWVDLVSYCSVFCDYLFIGDEHMAAQAVLSGDPWHPAQLIGVDFIKFMLIGVILAAFVVAALGSSISSLF
jgi:hypothetical protein